MIYDDEAFVRMLVREGRDERIIRSALKRGCVGGLPGAGRFVCPLCGSNYFGTSLPTNLKTEEGTGHCHGWTIEGRCSFAWNRREDAWVFQPSDTRESLTGVRS